MSGLNLRELEALRAVVIGGTTKSAAYALGISQPTVSRAIAQLEARLGVLLFTRSHGRLRPTAEAMAINSRLHSLFELIEKFECAVPSKRLGGTLRVAAPHAYASRFIQRQSGEFLRVHPDTELLIEAGSVAEVAERVAEGDVDLGIVDTLVMRAGVHYEPLRQSPACCVLPQGHALAEHAALSLADLANEGFVRISGTSSAPEIDKLFADESVKARVRVTTSDHVAACHFVTEGLGIAVMNTIAVPDVFADRIVRRPLTPEIACQLSYALPSDTPLSWQARSFMTALSMAARH